MNGNKIILKYCPNFYKIINFEYYEGDVVSDKIVKIYQDYIFKADITDQESLNKINEFDKIVAKYIDDYYFRREMETGLKSIRVSTNEKNILQIIIDHIFKIFHRYEEGMTRKIYISRWI